MFSRVALIGFAVAVSCLAQNPDPYPGTTPPTTGSPGPTKNPTGSHPPNGMPAPPLSRSKKKTVPGNKNTVVPTNYESGLLVRLSGERMVIQSADKRVLRFVLSPEAKYYRMKGDAKSDIAAADMAVGDHLSIDAVQDEDGVMTAIEVRDDKPGTQQDKQQVATLDESIVQARLEPIAGGEPDPEARPKMHYKVGQDRDNPQAKPVEQPPAKASSPAPPPASAQPDPANDDDRSNRQTTAVVSQSTSTDKGDDSFGRAPTMKRGKPRQRPAESEDDSTVASTPAPSPVAANKEAAAAPQQVASLKTKPDEWQENPSFRASANEHPALTQARANIDALLQTAPNYIVQQVTTRYQSETRHNPDWRAQDIISAEVVFNNGKEEYRNLKINFKPTKKTLDEIGGSKSTGEFMSMVADVFDPATAADFRYSHTEPYENHAAYVFKFAIDQPHSHWTVHAPSQSYKPAHKGTVWIDKETNKVLRIEVQGMKIPSEFPFDIVEMAADYEQIRIGSREFMLPVHAENLACEAATGQCTRNVIEFKNYRRFTAESEIIR